jgi:hypothetical protein
LCQFWLKSPILALRKESAVATRTCTSENEGFLCLTPGVSSDFNVQRKDVPRNFTVTLPRAKSSLPSPSTGECPEYYIGTFQAISTLGDPDFVISFNNPNAMSVVTFSDANDVVGWEIGSDRTTISVCLSSEKETTLFIQTLSYRVESTQWTVRYIFTPIATFRRIPLPELPQLYYNYFMVGSSRMECPDLNAGGAEDYFNCRWATSTVDCNSYYFLIPDEDPQPFWPRPNFFLSVSTVSLDNLTFSEIPQRPLCNRHTSALVFQATSASKLVSYSSERQLKSCSVRFNGRLSDSKGKVINATL